MLWIEDLLFFNGGGDFIAYLVGIFRFGVTFSGFLTGGGCGGMVGGFVCDVCVCVFVCLFVYVSVYVLLFCLGVMYL